jgi:hypothetical protein
MAQAKEQEVTLLDKRLVNEIELNLRQLKARGYLNITININDGCWHLIHDKGVQLHTNQVKKEAKTLKKA